MKPEPIAERLKDRLGKEMGEKEIQKLTTGVAGGSKYVIWCEIEPSALREAVQALAEIDFPHLTVISPAAQEEEIELIYHFGLGYGEAGGEVMINFRLGLDKKEPRISSIADLIPGALTTEREMTEFMGVEFEGIPDDSHLFLPDDMSVHPWRQDEEEVEDYVNKLDEQP